MIDDRLDENPPPPHPPAPNRPATAEGPPVFFETRDDHLAAFLVVRGCQPAGLGIGETADPSPEITHLFDGEPASRLFPLVSAYRDRHGDEVSATAFVSALIHLRTLRLDEKLRRRRQAESDLAKIRIDPDLERDDL